jgi:hypothetical protein
MNNLVGEILVETNRKRKRENADMNYHNYYVKICKFQKFLLLIFFIAENIIHDTARLGFPD